jgi:hypothetical protein
MRVQRTIVNAAGFRALKGFTDHAVRMQRIHKFSVSGRRLLRRFVRQVLPLIRDDLVHVKINGMPLRDRKAA